MDSPSVVLLRESLLRSDANTKAMVAVLSSFSRRVDAVDVEIHPALAKMDALWIMQHNVDHASKAADAILTQFDIAHQVEPVILKGPRDDSRNYHNYLEAITTLRGVMRYFAAHRDFRSSEGMLNNANNLLYRASQKLLDAFNRLLSPIRKGIDPDMLYNWLELMQPSIPNTTRDGHFDDSSKTSQEGMHRLVKLIDPKLLPLLHDSAQELIQMREQQQCFRIYRDARLSSLQLTFKALGLDSISRENVQKMQWENLEGEIGNWASIMRISFIILYPGERELLDRIFDGTSVYKDECFAEIVSGSVGTLLLFGDAVARSKKSPEKLFPLLDMCEVMHELKLKFNTIFGSKSCSALKEAALALTKNLARIAWETFSGFEHDIETDLSKTTPDGGDHALTSYVMNYLKLLTDYLANLQQIYLEIMPHEAAGNESGQVADVIVKIMHALLNNLEAKSKVYKDPALAHIFVMNNVQKMVASVKRPGAETLREMLGEDWIQKHRRIVQQNANNYRKIGWAPVYEALSLHGLASTGSSGADLSSASRSVIKDRLKSFNALFQELRLKQSQWSVPDSDLRESLKLLVAEVLLPAYRNFITRYGMYADRYITQTPEEVEQKLGELFKGSK